MESDRRQQSSAVLAAGGHEAWELEVIDPAGGGIGLSIGLVLQSAGAWWWTVVCGAERATVAVIDDQVPLPGWPNLEVRASGLWAEVGIQDPGEHVITDLEAFGVEVDDPDELLGEGRGIRRPVGLDVEWHRTASVVALDDGHTIAARVEGEILLGDEVIELSDAASGSWMHRWGPGPWWGPSVAAAHDGHEVASSAVNVGGWSWRRTLVRSDDRTFSWAVALVGSPDGRRSD